MRQHKQDYTKAIHPKVVFHHLMHTQKKTSKKAKESKRRDASYLSQGELQGAQRDASGGGLRVLGLEEHGVGDHGQEQQRHAARQALNAREVGARGAAEDGEPEVVVGQLLARGGREEVLEGDEVLYPGHGQDPVHHPVVLFHCQPAVTQEDRSEEGKLDRSLMLFLISHK